MIEHVITPATQEQYVNECKTWDHNQETKRYKSSHFCSLISSQQENTGQVTDGADVLL